MLEGQRPYARLTYCKVGRLRWLGHLDTSRALERALRRSGLPVAYSQGFNPHMKLSLAHPLPVGVEGLAELCAVDLAKEVSPLDIGKKLLPQLFDELQVASAQVLVRGRRSPFADLSVASYELFLSGEGRRWRDALSEALGSCLGADELLMQRQTKRKSVQVDIRPYIYDARLSSEAEGFVTLEVELGLGEGRLVKPEEVFQCLAQALPEGEVAVARTVRTGLR